MFAGDSDVMIFQEEQWSMMYDDYISHMIWRGIMKLFAFWKDVRGREMLVLELYISLQQWTLRAYTFRKAHKFVSYMEEYYNVFKCWDTAGIDKKRA